MICSLNTSPDPNHNQDRNYNLNVKFLEELVKKLPLNKLRSPAVFLILAYAIIGFILINFGVWGSGLPKFMLWFYVIWVVFTATGVTIYEYRKLERRR